MSLIAIRAKISCDACGYQFSVGLDPASKMPKDWTLFDEAEDAVRGSNEYESKDWNGGLSSSVQDEKMLCAKCTKEADEKP